MAYEFLGKRISGRFTIPSGIVTCYPPIIERIAKDIPEVGVITTKSIGPRPREGYREPIMTQVTPGTFVNAVGLTNPGPEEFVREMQKISLPKDKFVLTSIFGGTPEEFAEVAKAVEPVSDGVELNLSCPHAKGYGSDIGQDPEAVRAVVAAVKAAVRIPVVAKLTPNVEDIAGIARAAGADGFTAINTVGPEEYSVEGHPVLSNRVGGKSGRAVFARGVECVKAIRSVSGKPIVGCGGVFSAEDVRAYMDAGASVVGVGSSLIGLTTEELKVFFRALQQDVGKKTCGALLKSVDMGFTKYKLVENRRLADDLSLLVFDRGIAIKPGEYVFLWVPGAGEKPFSVLDDEPLTLAVAKRGVSTEKYCGLEPGATAFIRGPYGQPLVFPEGTTCFAVCGGTGFAALYKFAKVHKRTELFVGARDRDHLYFIEEARRFGKVHVATNDGSMGHRGLVTELLERRLGEVDASGVVFLNCGPPAMIEAAMKIEVAHKSSIFNSVDYVTKCGVGICGSCFDPQGLRSCVDGPFLRQ